MRTRFAKFSNGETFPILLGDDGTPDVWVTTYTSVVCRPVNDFNTIRNVVSRLRHLRHFEREFQRDFAKEFEGATFLDERDCSELRSYCWIDRKRYSAFRSKLGKPRISKNVFSIIKTDLPPQVIAETCAQRMRDITKFLVFVAETVNRTRLHDKLVRNSINDMKRRLEAAIPKVSSKGAALDPFQMAPPPEVFLKFIELADPNNPVVPFRGITRARNVLMFKILMATGMRIGELLCLRTDSRHLDLLASPPMIHIRKPSPHDKHIDERNLPPSQKTIERSIFITQELAGEIEDYINKERRSAIPARKHNWLFVNHRQDDSWGNPISLGNWGLTIGRLKKVDPVLFEGVKTHGFRHTFAYLWNKKVDAHNAKARANPELGLKMISEKERQDALMDVMGWTDPSSAAPYLKRYVKEIVDEVTLRGVEDLSMYIDLSIIGGDQ